LYISLINNQKVVFYNRQAGEVLRAAGNYRYKRGPQTLYLNWSGDAELICSELEAQGLTVERPASEASAIGIVIG